MFKYSKWLELPFDTRMKIATMMGVEKKGAIEVFQDKVVKDGYSVKELEDAITTESVQSFLGSIENDPTILWDKLVEMAKGTLTLSDEKSIANKPTELLVHKDLASVAEEIIKPKKTKKNA
jgi:hypothetical protein